MQWDERLTRRGIEYRPYIASPGEQSWKLIRGRYIDEDEARGKHHIFVDTLDENGQRITDVAVRFWWGSGDHIKLTESKPGEGHAVDFPMFAAGHSYGARINEPIGSDEVWGMGLGTVTNPHIGHHVSYSFVFQKTRTGTAPPEPEPPRGDDWEAVLQLAEKVRDIAARNVGAAQQRAVWTFEPELAAVTGVPLRAEWTRIAWIDWPNAPANIEIALCWRMKAKANDE